MPQRQNIMFPPRPKKRKSWVIAHIRFEWPFSLHHLISIDGCCHAPHFIQLITNIISFTQIVHDVNTL